VTLVAERERSLSLASSSQVSFEKKQVGSSKKVAGRYQVVLYMEKHHRIQSRLPEKMAKESHFLKRRESQMRDCCQHCGHQKFVLDHNFHKDVTTDQLFACYRCANCYEIVESEKLLKDLEEF
jgi:hypothetical protein